MIKMIKYIDGLGDNRITTDIKEVGIYFNEETEKNEIICSYDMSNEESFSIICVVESCQKANKIIDEIFVQAKENNGYVDLTKLGEAIK